MGALFNSNQWYHLYVNEDDKFAMKGTSLFKDGMKGATLFEKTDIDTAPQQWQVYTVENSNYTVMRTKDSGPDGFFSTQFAPSATVEGQILAYMARGNITDDSAYWQWTSWKDGTFYVTNKRNTTDWHLSEYQSSTLM
jgi:hypothetical protein